ncbi:MAG: YdeI/OmpD-associated family protein [Bacteroidota bacterium]
MNPEKFEKITVESQEELRDWLLDNYKQEDSVWLVTYKKSVPVKYISTGQVLDELLCFGWIDGVRKKLDEKRTMQLILPRQVQYWSRSYKNRAARLIEEGLMHESGLKSITISKESGLWNFMDDVDDLIIPNDLFKALKSKKRAFGFFDAINDSSKRFVLRWLKLSKTDKTRTNRIERIVTLSSKGKKLSGS